MLKKAFLTLFLQQISNSKVNQKLPDKRHFTDRLIAFAEKRVLKVSFKFRCS